jgi:type I restriction enzyme S subunit
MNVSSEGRIDRTTMKYVDADAGRSSIRLQSGDVLFNNTNSPELVGKTALFNDDDFPAFSNHMTRLRVNHDLLVPAYLAARLHQAWREGWFANHCNNHVSQASIGRDVLKTFEIELPPLDIQQGIAGLASSSDDRRFSASNHLALTSQAIDRFRKALLATACTGRLTADWRDGNPCESARVAIERSCPETQRLRRDVDPSLPALEYPGLPETWATMTVAQLLARGVLRDVKDGNHGAVHPKVSEFTVDGLPFITANLVRDGQIDYDSAPKVGGVVLGRLRVGFSEPGDVVLTHKGSVGRVGLATREAVLTPQTTYYRCSNQFLTPEYLAHYLASLYFYEQLAAVMSQTTRDFVPIRQQYGLSIILPPRQEQVEIARRVDRLLNLAKGIERRVDGAAASVAQTSQAVLAKAFRGDLTPSLSPGER